mmetsp:Transcript_22548/g.39984  ORF Transcript_22548/g.39984 Transcript_22548/m.39984 type:complete len:222 (+) Transcript_22548:38-703(+)
MLSSIIFLKPILPACQFRGFAINVSFETSKEKAARLASLMKENRKSDPIVFEVVPIARKESPSPTPAVEYTGPIIKQAPTAYSLFMSDRMTYYRSLNPTEPQHEFRPRMFKILPKEFKELDPKLLERYKSKSARLSALYYQQKEKFNPPKQVRGANAYQMYAKEHLPSLRQKYYNMGYTFSDMASKSLKELSENWNKLNSVEKSKYQSLSRQVKDSLKNKN